MSYTLTLGCGCTVYVSCHPRTRVAHTRIIERRGERCGHRFHDIGRRIALWELLPDRRGDASEDTVQRPVSLHG